MLREYKHSKHRSIGVSPEDALQMENHLDLFKHLYQKQEFKDKKQLHIGDKVRISIHKRLS